MEVIMVVIMRFFLVMNVLCISGFLSPAAHTEFRLLGSPKRAPLAEAHKVLDDLDFSRPPTPTHGDFVDEETEDIFGASPQADSAVSLLSVVPVASLCGAGAAAPQKIAGAALGETLSSAASSGSGPISTPSKDVTLAKKESVPFIKVRCAVWERVGQQTKE